MNLSTRVFYKRMLSLALPIALQNLLISCATLIDTAMVIELGNTSVAAIGVAARWTFMLNMVFFGISSGSAVLISQYWGARDFEGIDRTFGTALSITCIAAVLFNLAMFFAPQQLMAIFTPETAVIEAGAVYLRTISFMALPLCYSTIVCNARRSTENVSVPLLTSAFQVTVNTFLNYCLISGNFGFPALGLRGAGIATLTSITLQAVLVFIIGAKQKHFTFRPISVLFRLRKEFTLRYLRIAGPVLSNEIVWAVGTNIYAAIFARQGSENYAGFTIFSSVEQLSFVFFVGICNACAIMVGKSVGEGELDGAYTMAKRALVMTPLLGVVVGLGLVLIRNPVLSLMNIETETAQQIASQLLMFYGLWLAFRMIPYTCVVGIFRAGGDTKTGFFLDVGTMYFWGIPIVAVLAFFVEAPFVVVVLAMFIAEDFIKSIVCILHFRSKRWIRRLVFSMPPPQGEKLPETDNN